MGNALFYILCIFNGLLLIHVIHEVVLLFHALLSLRHKNKIAESLNHHPFITIQLPIFNEKYVVERLLDAINAINYPKEKLEVQILDDSTDETSTIIKEYLLNESSLNFDFQHIQRTNRQGFKAGALQHGISTAKGEFIAIFDADFIPDPNFLKKTIPLFQNEKVGLVQTRWTFINEETSILTKAQALMLNTHFSIEHLGRLHAGGFINFNGTAGIWRKEAINTSGGWQSDTLTEDLDLSFRAQIKGWQFKYLHDVGAPSELPVTFDAFRTQQFRWSKGAAECLRKNTKALWKSPVNLSAKTIGTFHLLNSSIYFLVMGIMVFSPAVYFAAQYQAINTPYYEYLSFLGPVTLGLLVFIFMMGALIPSRQKAKTALLFFPTLLFYFSMATGITLYMLFGVIEGYFGKKSDFVRTPKFGNENNTKSIIKKGYAFKKEYSLKVLEVAFLLYGISWIIVSIFDFNLMSLSYGIIVTFGYSLAVFLKHHTLKIK